MRLPKPFQFNLTTVVVLLAYSFFAGGNAVALDKPSGQVVLTVAGAVTVTNRGPLDEQEDGFFKFHDQTFERASAFDIPMLEALGSVSISVTYDKWRETVRLEGPRLTDLLKATGAAAGSGVFAQALDGFTAEISAEELAAQNWIVALKRNGEYLGIGGRGPVWLVYDPPNGASITDEDEGRWPWAVYFIAVR